MLGSRAAGLPAALGVAAAIGATLVLTVIALGQVLVAVLRNSSGRVGAR